MKTIFKTSYVQSDFTKSIKNVMFPEHNSLVPGDNGLALPLKRNEISKSKLIDLVLKSLPFFYKKRLLYRELDMRTSWFLFVVNKNLEFFLNKIGNQEYIFEFKTPPMFGSSRIKIVDGEGYTVDYLLTLGLKEHKDEKIFKKFMLNEIRYF